MFSIHIWAIHMEVTLVLAVPVYFPLHWSNNFFLPFCVERDETKLKEKENFYLKRASINVFHYYRLDSQWYRTRRNGENYRRKIQRLTHTLNFIYDVLDECYEAVLFINTLCYHFFAIRYDEWDYILILLACCILMFEMWFTFIQDIF